LRSRFSPAEFAFQVYFQQVLARRSIAIYEFAFQVYFQQVLARRSIATIQRVKILISIKQFSVPPMMHELNICDEENLCFYEEFLIEMAFESKLMRIIKSLSLFQGLLARIKSSGNNIFQRLFHFFPQLSHQTSIHLTLTHSVCDSRSTEAA